MKCKMQTYKKGKQVRETAHFKSGGLVDQINRKGPKYDLDYELEVKRSQLELDDPSRNRGQGPTKQNAKNLEYRRELDSRLRRLGIKRDDD